MGQRKGEFSRKEINDKKVQIEEIQKDINHKTGLLQHMKNIMEGLLKNIESESKEQHRLKQEIETAEAILLDKKIQYRFDKPIRHTGE